MQFTVSMTLYLVQSFTRLPANLWPHCMIANDCIASSIWSQTSDQPSNRVYVLCGSGFCLCMFICIQREQIHQQGELSWAGVPWEYLLGVHAFCPMLLISAIRNDGTEPHAHRESGSASRGKTDGEESKSHGWRVVSIICNNHYPRAEILKYSNLWIPFMYIY